MRNRIEVHPRRQAGALIILAFAATIPLAASERGSCVVAEVPSPYVLADGSVHPAGAIRLCTEQATSPAAGVHRIGASDGGASFALSHRARAEGGGDVAPTVLFRRQEDGRLLLVGYVVQERGRAVRYLMRPEIFRARNAVPPPPAPDLPAGDLVALVGTVR